MPAPDLVAGKYRLLRELGRGTFGTVHAARVEATGELVALKELTLEEPDARQRFEREVAVLTRLPPHPNVVRILDAGTHAGKPFLVLELVPGGSLAAALEAGLRPNVGEAVWLASRVAVALTHLHRSGVVHRDVSLGDILLGADGEPRLVDFGLALDQQRRTRLTSEGDLLGTPVAFAPEQLGGGRAADDPAIDTYAVSVLFYRLLTGHAPFESSRTLGELARRLLEEDPEPILSLRPEVPPGLARLVERGLSKDPAKRPRPTSELAVRAMEELARAGLVPSAPALPSAPLPPSAPAVPSASGPRAPLAERAAVRPGSRVGRYEIQEELGRGGMGVVYRGQAPDGKLVAIKLLTQSDSRTALARFAREQRLLASLGEADGFVPLVESGDGPSGPYLVMPFVAGGTLEARLRRGPLAIDEVVRLGRALARSLGRAHARGVVHRDVKPANVLFALASPGQENAGDPGTPLLADLGLAKHFRVDVPGASQSVALSKAGDFRGTPGFMAPEQMEDARTVGPPADVFALGATLFECLAGVAPFHAEGGVEVIFKVVRGEKASLAALRPETPGWLVATIERALASDPTQRFPDGEALARALEEGERTSQPPVLSRRTLVALGVAALALVAGAIGLVRGSSSKPPEVAPTTFVPVPRSSPVPSPEASPPPDAPLGPRPELAFADPPRIEELARDPSLAQRESGSKDDHGFQGLALTPGGTFALAAHGRYVSLWHLALAREQDVFRGHMDGVEAVAIAPDGKTALTAGDDASVRLWTVPGGEMLAIYAGHFGPVNAIAYSADGKRAISGGGRGADRTVRLWPLEEAARPAPRTPPRVESSRELGSHGSQLLAVAFSPGGHRAFSVERYGIVKTWDAQLGYGELRAVDAGVGYLSAAAFGRDGRRGLMGAEDGRVALVDLEGKRPTLTLGQHGGNVTAAAFSPDGTFAVTGSKDHSLRLWDLELGQEASRQAVPWEPWYVAFTPDGQAVLVASQAGKVSRVGLSVPRGR